MREMQLYLGYFLNINTEFACQQLGTIINYNFATKECRVQFCENCDDDALRNECKFEVMETVSITEFWGYVYGAIDLQGCEGICKSINECAAYSNYNGCHLFNNQKDLTERTVFKTYLKICSKFDESLKSKDSNPFTLNSTSAATLAVILSCIIGTLLLLVVMLFIFAARRRSQKFSNLYLTDPQAQ
eukprot:NODE_468_length_8097_cov_0.251813.p5 type:complete len:187 gc:universal NODE_468_length_8097_cov_0.251813:739-1299(+)